MSHPRRKNLRVRKLHVERLEERALLTGDLELLADVNQTALPGTMTVSGTLTQVAIGNILYFASSDATHGTELWKTDGTVAGTVLVKDINPGTGGSQPSQLTNVNGVIYFRASDGINGYELWQSDGTSVGTFLVSDINVGSSSSSPFYLTNHNGALLFAANDGSSGNELWRSTGAAGETQRVLDIRSGAGSSIVVSSTTTMSAFVVVGSDVFFVANDGTTGSELWRSDGSELGTLLVKDILAGSSSAFAWPNAGLLPNPAVKVLQFHATNASGALFFAADDGITGAELWKSDGTEAGTLMVRDINPGVASAFGSTSFGNLIVSVGGEVYFPANDGATGLELWRSDGSEVGTGLVQDISPGASGSLAIFSEPPFSPALLTVLNSEIYFSANDGASGRELWKTDGTTIGTSRVKDIFRGATSSVPTHIHAFSGSIYFRANDGVAGVELWRTDGSEAGTVLVKDVVVGQGNSNISALISSTDRLYFRTSSSVLHQTDGTSAGTIPVIQLHSNLSVSSGATDFTVVDDKFIFAANDGMHGVEFWSSDGTTAGTNLLQDIYPGTLSASPRGPVIKAGSDYYFTAVTAGTGFELWKLDSTLTVATLVKDIVPGAQSSLAANLTEFNGLLYFTARDLHAGTELWRTDGTDAGTVLVKDIRAGVADSYPTSLRNVAGTLYFTANDGVLGEELWRSDGTSSGTKRVVDLYLGTTSSLPANLTEVSGVLYFVANNSYYGRELWCLSDVFGLKLVADLNPGLNSSFPAELTNVDGTLFFNAQTSGNRYTIWKTIDGGFAQFVKDIPNARNLTSINGGLFFTASNGATGIELWKSDGTESGTVLVKDIFPGAPSSNPSSLTNIGGILYFAASDGVHGQELWRSDGTEAGTYLVQDLTGDSGGSSPVPFDFGGRLVVIATTEATGRELFIESLAGDFNRDNAVTTADYDFWRDNFGATTGPGLKADGNHDGLVDTADYTIWRDNYVPPAPIATATAAVSALAPTPPLARDLALTPPQNARPLGNSPPRRGDLLIAARDAAFADLGLDDFPSPTTTSKPPARKIAPPKTTVKAKL